MLKHCQQLGAGGIQARIDVWENDFAGKVRAKLESSQMYLEGKVGLPREQSEVAQFESVVLSAKAAGASILRTVSLGGRRYEALDSADGWREFLERAWKSLVLAEPVVRKHRLRLAIENHKDWRAPELLEVLKRLGSEQVGVCVDTGNSIALLENPLAVVEAYAPHAFTSHLKDMAVQEYEDGFLLSEVPLGDGFLDLPKMIATLRRDHLRQVEEAIAQRDLRQQEAILVFLNAHVLEMRRESVGRVGFHHREWILQQRDAVARIDADADLLAAEPFQNREQLRRPPVLVVLNRQPQAVLADHRFGEHERFPGALQEFAPASRRVERFITATAQGNGPQDRGARRFRRTHDRLEPRHLGLLSRQPDLALQIHLGRFELCSNFSREFIVPGVDPRLDSSGAELLAMIEHLEDVLEPRRWRSGVAPTDAVGVHIDTQAQLPGRFRGRPARERAERRQPDREPPQHLPAVHRGLHTNESASPQDTSHFGGAFPLPLERGE